MSDKTAILFMAHYLNDSILREFYRLRKSQSSHVDVRILYDNSKKTFDESHFDGSSGYFLYDINDLIRNYPFLDRTTPQIVPGNCVFPMLLFAQKNPCKYFWRIEYDARFSGDWKMFFDSFEENDSDLLGTTIYRYEFRPDWNWWNSLKAPSAILDKKWFLRGFFPVLRLSKKAIDLLENSYRDGWRGHDEVTIPTILNYYGYTIEDIGGDGEFVKPDNRNRFYTNTPGSPGLAPGTFVYHPYPCNYSDIPNMLYHPVKE